MTGNNVTNVQGAYNLSSGIYNLGVDIAFNSWFDARLSNRSLTVNGTTTSTSSQTIPDFTGSCTFGIFGFYNGNTGSVVTSSGVVASVKIYKDGNLVRSFVPVRIGSTGCLFDRVTGQFFYNQGTGSFVCGEDDFSIFSYAVKHVEVMSSRPYDAEVEYIESTGTQYIDTGVAVSDPSTIAIEAEEDVTQPLGFTHQNVVSGTWVARYSPPSATENLYIYYKDYSKRVVTSANETRKTARWDGSSGYYENGVSLTSFVASVGSDSINSRNWLYGAVWDFNANAVDFRSSRAGKIYGLKVKVSGVIVRDFVPVRVGTEYCLYDKANPTGGDNGDGLYHNKGTGAFLGGSDTGPSIVLASRVFGKDPAPPYDAQVEYIESSGTQWIDTGFTPNQNTSAKFKVMNLAVTGSCIVGYQAGNDSQDWRFFNYNTAVYMDVWSGRTNSGTGRCNSNTWYEFEVGNLYVKNLSTGTMETFGTAISSFTGTATIKLNQTKSGDTPSQNRFAWVKIYDNGTLVRDLIPVRVGTEYCMYDQVNPRGGDNGDGLYHNKGSGAFTGGSDTVVPTVEWSVLFKAVRRHYDMPMQYTIDERNGNAPAAVNVYFPSAKYDALDYTPTWSGHRFVGWYTTSATPSTTAPTSGTQVQKGDSVVFDRSTVYARWQLPTTVTFDATTNGGQMPSGWVSPDYYEGQPYGTIPTPTKSDEVFLGWFTSGGTRVTESSIVSSGTLTARYAAVTYDTSFQVTTTSSYRKTGIYSAASRNSSNPTVVDWGDGTTDVVYGNISQLAHTYSSDGTFTVQVNDNISNIALSTNTSAWYDTTSQNRYTVKKLTALGANITAIPSAAFMYCSAMTDALLPSNASFKTIPQNCFAYCTTLKPVTIPSTVTTITYRAFQYIDGSQFTAVTIPSSVTSIGDYAFYNCNYLHSVTFESSSNTLTLGTYAFAYCFNKTAAVGTIDLSPRKITSIPNYCFYYCQYLKGITWPQGVTSIGGYAFRYCFRYSSSAGTVEIPEGVTSISGTYAFANCSHLTAVTLPSTLTNLNNYTFYYCMRLATITSNRTTAPTVSAATFGNSATYYTGRTSYSAGTNKLYVPAGATGYNASYWLSPLCNSTMCGFTLVYVQKRVYDITYQGDTIRVEFNFTDKTASILSAGSGALSDAFLLVQFDSEWDVFSAGASQGEPGGNLLMVWTNMEESSDFNDYSVVYASSDITYSEVTA